MTWENTRRVKIAKLVNSQEGITLPQMLVSVLLLSALTVVAVPLLLGKTENSENYAAQVSVAKSVSTVNKEVLFNNNAYPSYESMISILENASDGIMTFHPYDGQSSTGPNDVTVERESDYQASFCSKSETGLVYCARQNSLGLLQTPEYVAYARPPDNPFNGQAWASRVPLSNSDTHSLCVGLTEEASRGCLAEPSAPPTDSGAAVSDWGAVPSGETPEPEPDPEPEPEPLDYQGFVNSLGPGAQCPFDESGTSYVNLKCTNINGQFQPTSPTFTLQNQGAILSDPASKAVGFNGDTHYSYGNPGGGSTNNQRSNWTATVWTKLNNGGTNTGIISADDNWAFQSSGASGFTCSMRIGNPWSVRQVTGGPQSVAGTWYFLACTYDNGVLTLYVNGVQVASISGVPIGQSGNGNFRPGYVSSGWTGGGYLNGYLDQFNFFGKTLTSEDVAELYYQAGY